MQKKEAMSHRRSQPILVHSRVVGFASGFGSRGACRAIQELAADSRRSHGDSDVPHQRPSDGGSSFLAGI